MFEKTPIKNNKKFKSFMLIGLLAYYNFSKKDMHYDYIGHSMQRCNGIKK